VRNGPLWSSKVVDFDTNRKRVCNFLLVINSNLGPVLPSFRDIASFLLRTATPPLLHPNFRVVPLGLDCQCYMASRSEDAAAVLFGLYSSPNILYKFKSSQTSKARLQSYIIIINAQIKLLSTRLDYANALLLHGTSTNNINRLQMAHRWLERCVKPLVPPVLPSYVGNFTVGQFANVYGGHHIQVVM